MTRVSKKVNIKFWREEAAKKYTSRKMEPHRPSRGELEIYEKLLRKIVKLTSGREALVLGATPSLRDLLTKYSFHNTIVDINLNNIKAMDLLLKRKEINPKKVVSNWLKMKFLPDSFDVILGDHVFSNTFPLSNWPVLAQCLQKICKTKGYLIQNIIVNRASPMDLKKLISLYRKKAKVFKKPCKRWYYYYRVLMTDSKFYDQEYNSHWGKFDEELEKFYQKKLINKKELEDLKIDLGKGVFPMPPKKVADKILDKYFKIISANFSHQYPLHRFYCIYFLKNK